MLASLQYFVPRASVFATTCDDVHTLIHASVKAVVNVYLRVREFMTESHIGKNKDNPLQSRAVVKTIRPKD